MPRLAIPDFGIEYPEYEYRPWPKHVGYDEEGNQLAAHSEEEFRRLKELAVYPKVIGKDKDGKDVIAADKRDEDFQRSRVVNAANALTEEPVRRGPGRPRSEAA